jgi:Zn-dependent alcohol dehydrogenase
VLPQGLGRLGDHRRGGRGPGDLDAPVPARHRPVWKGTAFGGARGRTDVPRIVDWYMDGKLSIDELITHELPLERINEGFELMERGESNRSGGR